MTQPPEWEAPGGSDGADVPPPPPAQPHQSQPDTEPVSQPGQGGPAGQPNPYGPPPAGQGYPYGPGAYPPGAHGTLPPQQKSGLSITAFILGLLGCIPLFGLAAVIVGVVALVKKQALRGLAIAGIVLGTLSIVATIALLASGAVGRFTDAVTEVVESAAAETEGPAWDSDEPVDHWAVPGGLAVGDCLNDPAASVDGEGQLADEIQSVTCDEPHDLEVYEVITLPEGDFPGDAAIEELAQSTCLEEFEVLIGLPYEESEFEIYYYYPFEDTWNFADDRSITCTVGSLTGRSTGTLEGANS